MRRLLDFATTTTRPVERNIGQARLFFACLSASQPAGVDLVQAYIYACSTVEMDYTKYSIQKAVSWFFNLRFSTSIWNAIFTSSRLDSIVLQLKSRSSPLISHLINWKLYTALNGWIVHTLACSILFRRSGIDSWDSCSGVRNSWQGSSNLSTRVFAAVWRPEKVADRWHVMVALVGDGFLYVLWNETVKKRVFHYIISLEQHVNRELCAIEWANVCLFWVWDRVKMYPIQPW